MKQPFGVLATVGLMTVFAGATLDHGLNARLTAQVQAPAPQDHNHATDTTQPPAADQSRQDMMAARQEMMANMKAADAKLNGLVQTMNATKGNEKVEAMATLLTALVQDHAGMRAGMAQGMSDCPMMKAGDMSTMMNMMMNMKK